MPADSEMLGLVIVIYGTLLAVFAWIVHMIRSAPHPHFRASTRLEKNGARR